MFKLNVDLNTTYPFVYSLCDFNIWHARLCYVNKRVISNASNLGLIPKLNVNDCWSGKAASNKRFGSIHPGFIVSTEIGEKNCRSTISRSKFHDWVRKGKCGKSK